MKFGKCQITDIYLMRSHVMKLNNKTYQIKMTFIKKYSYKRDFVTNTLDTFLHRIRTEIVDESKHTQNKTI